MLCLSLNKHKTVHFQKIVAIMLLVSLASALILFINRSLLPGSIGKIHEQGCGFAIKFYPVYGHRNKFEYVNRIILTGSFRVL